MRLLFFILLFANLAFFAYAYMAEQQDDVDGRVQQLQINPDKIRPVSSDDGAASALTPEKLGQVSPTACLEWGLFAGPDVARADAAIARLDLPPALVQRTLADTGGYWVYMPPQKNRAEVDKKIGELRAFGVTEFFVVQDVPQWRNAISLGIFKSEDGAKKFLESLREKGVRSAVVAHRENFLKQIAYFVREPDQQMVARLAELQREFPGSEIRAVACPATVAGMPAN
ncbi:MAG: SPOR domain-containing protein [Burkholderiales bacterium]|nr:SPOR domain-containing protein [Burkholderiales bacterium]